jgi:hypothetical protein
MVRDIKPHLEYVANRNAVVQNNGAKHGFVVPGNADIHVRIDIYGACRESELLENPWLHALYIKVGLYPVHEPEPERFGGGKQRETRPRPMNTGVLVPCMAVLPFFGPDIRADRFPERVLPSSKNPANSHFGHAPLIGRQPTVHQFFDPHDA